MEFAHRLCCYNNMNAIVLIHHTEVFCMCKNLMYKVFAIWNVLKAIWVLFIPSGIINPRRACAARVTVLGLCVCLLVNISHLTGLFVPQTILTFLTVDEGSKRLSDFLWKCFIAKLEHFLFVRLHDKSAVFYSVENVHAYECGPRG